ncbi:hypothetical protein [Streptomyces sp. LN325]|uniref:hypothetical protein n=1 Tax=Streptomyces sp. LN325 TaxID=3112976 RepID=UPI003712C33E
MAGRFATTTGCSMADRVPPPHNVDGHLSDHGTEKIVLDLRVHRTWKEPTRTCASTWPAA